jgi:hypothetical protein
MAIISGLRFAVVKTDVAVWRNRKSVYPKLVETGANHAYTTRGDDGVGVCGFDGVR